MEKERGKEVGVSGDEIVREKKEFTKWCVPALHCQGQALVHGPLQIGDIEKRAICVWSVRARACVTAACLSIARYPRCQASCAPLWPCGWY